MPRELDFDKWSKALVTMFSADTLNEILIAAADATGVSAVAFVLDEYPPESPGRPTPPGRSPIRTPKQKRWWWATMNAIAKGESPPEELRGWKAAYKKVAGRKTIVISGGYKRTGTMVRGITHKVTKVGKLGVDIKVGASMARNKKEGYADYVIGLPPPKGQQAAIHQDRWIPLVTILKKRQPELYKIFIQNIGLEMQKRWKSLGG